MDIMSWQIDANFPRLSADGDALQLLRVVSGTSTMSVASQELSYNVR